jgi:hypothetical protein
MANGIQVVSAILNPAQFAAIVQRLGPAFEDVYANTLTWAYRAAQDLRFPQGLVTVRLDRTVTDHTRGVQVVRGTLSHQGWTYVVRPDGAPIQIVLSCRDGVPPSAARQIDWNTAEVSRLADPVVIETHLFRRSATRQQPLRMAA